MLTDSRWRSPNLFVRSGFANRIGRFATGGVTTFGYDVAAREISQSFATGAQMSRGYDANSQITSTVWLETGGNQWVTNTYDPNGSRVTAADILGNLTTYTMDAKDRLTQDSTTGPNAHLYNYTFDVVDNILTNNEIGTNVTSMYDLASRLTTSIAGTATNNFLDSTPTETKPTSTMQGHLPRWDTTKKIECRCIKTAAQLRRIFIPPTTSNASKM